MKIDTKALRELDELAEAARLLGATQAKRLFGCHTDEDRRFERAMYESIDKHRAALCELLTEELREARQMIRDLRMGLRYAVRVWVLSDEIKWSEAEIDAAVERIIGDAKATGQEG